MLNIDGLLFLINIDKNRRRVCSLSAAVLQKVVGNHERVVLVVEVEAGRVVEPLVRLVVVQGVV